MAAHLELGIIDLSDLPFFVSLFRKLIQQLVLVFVLFVMRLLLDLAHLVLILRELHLEEGIFKQRQVKILLEIFVYDFIKNRVGAL